MEVSIKRLGELAETITKGTTPTSLGMNFAEGGIAFLRVQNIEHGKVFFEKETLHIDEKTHRILKRSQIRARDILVTIAGSIGRAAIVPDNAPDLNCNQAVAIVRIQDKVFHPYLRLWLESEDAQTQMRGATVTGTISNLSLTQLGNLQVPLPPIAQQKRIAAILDQAEALRSHRREAIGLLDKLGRSVFLEMFGDPVTNPMGWNRVPFSELLSSIESGKSPNCLDRPAIKGEWGVLKLGAVTWCEYNPLENKALPPQEKPDPIHEVKAGDLLFTRKNTYDLIAACVLVRCTPTRLLLPDLIFRFRLRPDSLMDSCFLHQLLIEPRKRREMQKLASGSSSSMPNISKAKLQTVLIEVPPLPLQQQFAQRIAAIEALKATQREALSQLDALFASLQHRAFRGEL
jgi:type I restriction enzyme, S subunit